MASFVLFDSIPTCRTFPKEPFGVSQGIVGIFNPNMMIFRVRKMNARVGRENFRKTIGVFHHAANGTIGKIKKRG